MLAAIYGSIPSVRRFSCPTCSARVFFAGSQCLNCSTTLAYDLAADRVVANTEPCRNRPIWACNWVAANDAGLCEACALTTEADGTDAHVEVFQVAIRRVLRQLVLFGLDPTEAEPPLRFALRASTPDEPVITGHADGLITLDTAEGDPAHREAVRTRLGEGYRTPLGHVRHELGHWHWQAYIEQNPELLTRFRDLFGNEALDYPTALAKHYERKDTGGWRDSYLSYYASSHPWEDYAESFAHVLHMHAIVETAYAEGFITSAADSLARLYGIWAPLTVSLNEIAQAMGTAEPYPFAPSATALAKMSFVYEIIANG